MGADFYLRSVYTKYEAQHRPAFERALAARDAAILRVSVEEQLDSSKPELLEHPRVATLQQACVDAMDKLHDNPGSWRSSYNAGGALSALGWTGHEEIPEHWQPDEGAVERYVSAIEAGGDPRAAGPWSTAWCQPTSENPALRKFYEWLELIADGEDEQGHLLLGADGIMAFGISFAAALPRLKEVAARDETYFRRVLDRSRAEALAMYAGRLTGLARLCDLALTLHEPLMVGLNHGANGPTGNTTTDDYAALHRAHIARVRLGAPAGSAP